MPKFTIRYTKIQYCSCDVDAQNEEQVKYLFAHERLDLDNEQYGNTDLGEIRSVERR
jgi:hypothetical protein